MSDKIKEAHYRFRIDGTIDQHDILMDFYFASCAGPGEGFEKVSSREVLVIVDRLIAALTAVSERTKRDNINEIKNIN